MRNHAYPEATDFLTRLFGGTEHAVELRSFPNEAGGAGKQMFTRDPEMVVAHCRRFDMLERGMFFGTATRKLGVADGHRVNIVECPALWADIDCLKHGISGAAALAAMRTLPFPPSVVIDSGGGLHAYWLLREPLLVGTDQEGWEDTERDTIALLKQLAGVLAGDPKVCELARVMRLPGTHNTKPEVLAANGDDPTLVTVLEGDWRAYDLPDLVDWLDWQRPVLTHGSSPWGPVPIIGDIETNPYLAAAQKLGFKPPVDIEQALAAMTIGGAGDTSIHQTQLRVSASLAGRGMDDEEVVAILVEATRAAAGQAGQSWNWRREEAAIRRMTVEARAKFGTREQAVVNLASARAERVEANGTTGTTTGKARAPASKKGHAKLGQAVIEGMAANGMHVLTTGEGWVWRYSDKLWSRFRKDELKWLDVTIQTACDQIGITSDNKLISETKQWILRQPTLYRDDVPWDEHGLIPVRGGLLDHRTMTIVAASPEQYATWRVETEFDPRATCPFWVTMLHDLFGDRDPEERDACIGLLQEILGMSLIEDKPRALTRALILEGASETGKSKVLEVLGGITSIDPISTPLDFLSTQHGLMEFAQRAPWVLHEAFAQGKWHVSSIVKAILTGDPVQINIKSGPIYTRRIRSPIFWGTNHPPQFKEATKAIVNRLIIVRCRTVFSPKEPVGVAKEAIARGYSEPSDLILGTERAGLLNWAVEGCRRAVMRGYFATTAEMDEALETVREDSNIIAGFVKECISYQAYGMVSTPDFCAAFAIWWQENKGEDRYVPSNESVGRALTALGDSKICTSTVDMRDKAMRYYGGIYLNEVGLDYWEATKSSDLSSGKKSRLSTGREVVNRAIPSAWSGRASIARMEKEHAPRAVTAGDGTQKTTVTAVTHGENRHPPGDRTPRF